ncbi:MAG: hypothetical protein J6328_01560 [Bacilli bacterium]|nr:hypothetical protein [Bacilli bacterium]
MKEELLKGLTKEQIEKVRACKSQEEILAIAKGEGVELTEEQLAAVAGGACTTEPAPNPTPRPSIVCPRCGDYHIIIRYFSKQSLPPEYECNKCGFLWGR